MGREATRQAYDFGAAYDVGAHGMITNKKLLAFVAVLVVALLAALGIDRIGGETWVSAAAKAEAGWRAEVRPYSVPPVPFLREWFAPVLLVATAALLAVVGAALKWFSGSGEDGPAEPPHA